MSIRTRRNSKRLLAGVLAGAFALSGVAISTNVSADDGEVSADATQTRIGGANRYETAVAVAERASTTPLQPVAFNNARTVILATGENFPDGLSAAGLVGGLTGGPADVAVVGLTQTNALPAATAGMIEDIPTLNLVVVMGGTAAIADSVIDEIAELRGWTAAQTAARVVRIAGTNRYDTALKAVQTWVALGAGANAIENCAILVTGDNFPDALSAGSLAVNNSCPILLNSGSTVRPEVTAALAAIGSATDITVVGGTTVIPNSVVAALRTAGHTVTRIAGANRYATAQAVANELGAGGTATAPTYTSPAAALLASGTEFADALSASPLTAGNTPILLAPVAAPLPTATANWLTWNSNQVNALFVIGGTAAISAEAATAARTAATAVAPAVTQTLGLVTGGTNASLVIEGATGVAANQQVTLSANPAGPLAGVAGNGWDIDVTIDGAATTSQAPVISNQNKLITLTLAGTGANAVTTLAAFRTYWNSQSTLTSRFTMSNNAVDPAEGFGTNTFGPTEGASEVGFVVAVLNTVCTNGAPVAGTLAAGPVGTPTATQATTGLCGNNTQQNPLLWGGTGPLSLRAALQGAGLTNLQIAAAAQTLPAAPLVVFLSPTGFEQQWPRVEIGAQAIQSSATPALVNPSTIRSNITWVPVTL